MTQKKAGLAGRFLNEHRHRRILLPVLCALSLATALSVSGWLMRPAVSQESSNPTLTAAVKAAAFGDPLTVHLTATADAAADTFVVSVPASGASLSGVTFGSDETAQIAASEGTAVTLHRQAGTACSFYWFALDSGSSASFDLRFVSAEPAGSTADAVTVTVSAAAGRSEEAAEAALSGTKISAALSWSAAAAAGTAANTAAASSAAGASSDPSSASSASSSSASSSTASSSTASSSAASSEAAASAAGGASSSSASQSSSSSSAAAAAGVRTLAAAYGTCTVIFDSEDDLNGTYAMSGSTARANNGRQVSSVASGSTITLPTETSLTNSGYVPDSTYSQGYTLRGWYEIYSGTYYQPGVQVSVSSNMTFYADWLVSNYNVGKTTDSGVLAVGTATHPDTSNYITTEMFDYNSLVNIPGVTLASSSTSSESWNDALGNSFLFIDTGNMEKAEKELGKLICPLNRGDDLKNCNRQYSKTGDCPGTITSGIFNYANALGLFNTNSSNPALGVTYVGQGKDLYLYNNDSSSAHYGYYYYDSTLNAASYNQGTQSFILYDHTVETSASEAGNKSDFLPFNTSRYGADYDKGTGAVNYWFGMKSSVRFTLADNSAATGHGTLNQSTTGKDMTFEFSGDDDVWVFVDDTLVLDLGGIHHIVKGNIDFSTGVATTFQNNDSTGVPKNFSFSAGDHTLTVYYLERGASQSNCSIYFNIIPRYTLELTKQDADSQTKLAGAQFSVYTDENCTVPAQLWDSMADWAAGNETTNSFTTDANGLLSCYGLLANRTYYLKEVTPPTGYPECAKLIKLKLDSKGAATYSVPGDEKLTDEKAKFVASFDQDTGTNRISITAQNRKPQTTEIAVEKTWIGLDGKAFTPDSSVTAVVTLYRSTETIGAGGNTGSHTVKICTQYFGSSNGSNLDTPAVTAGNLSQSVSVADNGSVNFTIRTKTGSNGGYNLGIYSVTANGTVIAANANTTVTAAMSGGNKVYWGGNWTSDLPVQASYSLSGVTADTTVTVTFIGYLNYSGGTPLVSETASITDLTASGSTDTGTSSRTLDNITEWAGAVGEAVTLNSANGWKTSWSGLFAYDSSGNLYHYYVVEDGLPQYSVSYSNNGTASGTIAVTNTRTPSADAGGVELQHNKTIDYLNDGTANPDTDLTGEDFYRLYLDISGKQKPVDLLLVVDRSGSMYINNIEQNGTSVKRSQAVVNLLTGQNGQKGFISTFLNMNSGNKVAVSWFAGYWAKDRNNETYTSYPFSSLTGDKADAGVALNWTSAADASSLLTNGSGRGSGEIGGIEANGTDYMAGLWQAADLLQDSSVINDGHLKVMVFLSDGIPTHYISTGYNYSSLPAAATYAQYKAGTTLYRMGTGAENQTGEDIVQKRCITSADDVIKSVRAVSGLQDTKFYAIAFQTSVTDALKALSPSYPSAYQASSSDSLSNALNAIIKNAKATNVVVTDNLSADAAYYADQPDLLVTRTSNATGEKTILWQNGAATAAGSSILQSVTYEASSSAASTGTVKLTFLPDFTMDDLYTYTVSFNVKVTDSAYAKYAAGGYGGTTGDAGTDYGTNTTSSGQPGFHSNASADVSFTTDGKNYDLTYDDPVVQVRLLPVYLVKRGNSTDGKKLSGVTFELYRAAVSDGVWTKDGNAVLTGTTDAAGALILPDLRSGCYLLCETKAAAGYQLPASPWRITVSAYEKTVVFTDGDGTSLQPSNGAYTLVNTANFTLPRTGGPGTRFFAPAGILLMTGALAALWFQKKKRSERGNGSP